MRLTLTTMTLTDVRKFRKAGWSLVRLDGSSAVMTWPREDWPTDPRNEAADAVP